jgi:hypothetical protein
MTALANKRALRKVVLNQIELPAAASTTYFQGSVVGFDLAANGILKKAAPLVNFRAIGTVAEDKTLGAGGGTILVNLFREIICYWMTNDGTDTVVANDIGQLCYWLDDQTVKRDDDTNTLSVAGRVWRVDAQKGVLVEPDFHSGGDLSALDS